MKPVLSAGLVEKEKVCETLAEIIVLPGSLMYSGLRDRANCILNAVVPIAANSWHVDHLDGHRHRHPYGSSDLPVQRGASGRNLYQRSCQRLQRRHAERRYVDFAAFRLGADHSGRHLSVQVVVKDFVSGEKTSKTVTYQITPLVTGTTAAVVATAHPLVALFGAPACPVGSMKRVTFQQQSKATPPTSTNWANCHATGTMNFEIAGMYPSTTYQMYGQTNTGGTITNGADFDLYHRAASHEYCLSLPLLPIVPPGSQADTALKVVLRDVTGTGAGFAVATDLSGKIIWYYSSTFAASTYMIVTRPLVNGGMLSIQNGLAWNPASQALQILRQTDLAGNVVRETNTGAIQQQLLALGATGFGTL